MPDHQGKNGRFVLLVALIFGIDQLTKWLVLFNFNLYERSNVIPGFFDLTLVYNSGAAFSFLANAGGWQKYLFMGLALAVCTFFSFEIKRNKLSTLGKIAASFIMGGALGNAFDRLVHADTSTAAHGVVDFLLFYYQNWFYPAFNLADSFICVGAVLFIWEALKSKNKTAAQTADTTSK